MHLSSDLALELAALLHKYKIVFGTPTGLPLERDDNHVIHLIHGANPVKVRSYRYPNKKKNQIKKVIHEMVEESLIQPNNSPFFLLQSYW